MEKCFGLLMTLTILGSLSEIFAQEDYRYFSEDPDEVYAEMLTINGENYIGFFGKRLPNSFNPNESLIFKISELVERDAPNPFISVDKLGRLIDLVEDQIPAIKTLQEDLKKKMVRKVKEKMVASQFVMSDEIRRDLEKNLKSVSAEFGLRIHEILLKKHQIVPVLQSVNRNSFESNPGGYLARQTKKFDLNEDQLNEIKKRTLETRQSLIKIRKTAEESIESLYKEKLQALKTLMRTEQVRLIEEKIDEPLGNQKPILYGINGAFFQIGLPTLDDENK